MNGNSSKLSDSDLRAALESINERLERVEKQLGIEVVAPAPEEPVPPVLEEPQPVSRSKAPEPESLEFEVGQTWFALIGIVALAIGMAFLLSLPFASLPPWAPSLFGYFVTILIFYVARISRHSFEVISKYLRGAGMLLLFFSGVRLSYFGATPVLLSASAVSLAIFAATIATNVVLAWRRNSKILWVLAVITGCGAALAAGSTWFMAFMLTALVIGSAYAQIRKDWRQLAPAVFTLVTISYFVWAIGNPLAGNALGIVKDSYGFVFLIPLWMTLFSYAVMNRPDRETEDGTVQVSGLLICGFGFLVYFIHNFLGYDNRLVISQVVMAILLLAIALVYWRREKSSFSTFVFAMTGYMALSMALLKGFDSPEVFVALSVQSLVVIATAIYFSSKFIIVANWLIFIGIILGYIAMSGVGSGMSVGFGIVALISARILNWQKQRLTLETEFMRNAYLTIAFIVLPYSLYYLAPDKFVAVAWLGLSLFYYGLFLFFGNRKYRWMGHMTLLLTAMYVIVIGTARLDSHYRIITFLALGSIMVIVSLIFSLIRARQAKTKKGEDS